MQFWQQRVMAISPYPRASRPWSLPEGEAAAGSAAGWTFHLARLAWIVLAITLSVKALLVPVDHSVYPCFEAGGRAWWSGESVYPLSCEHQFRYGPVCAMALVPLALLPTPDGGLLWIWLNLGVFFVALRTLMKRILPVAWTPEREGLFLSLALLGILRSIWSGQSNLLVFGLVVLGAVAILDRRWWRAGWLLAIPVHIKVWPLAAAMLLIACWPRRLAARLAVCLVGVGLLPFLTKPFLWVCRQYAGWFEVLTGPANAAIPIATPGPSGRRSTRRSSRCSTWRCNWPRPSRCWGCVSGRPGETRRSRGCCCSSW